MLTIALGIHTYELDDSHLHELIHDRHLSYVIHHVFNGTGHVGVYEHHQGIALACSIRFCDQEGLDELRRIANKVFVSVVNAPYGHHSILTYVAVPVVKTLAHGWHKRLQDFWLLDLLEKAECRSADVFVWVLQIVADGIANKNHLLF